MLMELFEILISSLKIKLSRRVTPAAGLQNRA